MIDRKAGPQALGEVNDIDAAAARAPSQRPRPRSAMSWIMDGLVAGFGSCGAAISGDPLPADAGAENHHESSEPRGAKQAVLLPVNPALSSVELEARGLLGDRASEWMGKPNRLLDGIAPAELAASPEGAACGPVRAATSKCQFSRRAGGAIPHEERRRCTM